MWFGFTAPQGSLTVQARDNLLVFLDAVGKVSLVDTFFLLFGEAVLSLAFAQGNDEVRFHLEPGHGFLAFYGATILSLLLGHVLLLLHRLEHNFLPASFALASRASRGRRLLVATLLVGSAVSLPLAFVMPCVKFTPGGALAAASAVFEFPPSSVHTLVDLVVNVSAHSSWVSWLIMTFVVLFTLVFPVLLVLCCAILWYAHLDEHQRFKTLCAAQCLRAWSCLDVVAVTLGLAAWQLDFFLKAMSVDPHQAFGSVCRMAVQALEKPCLAVETEVLPGAFALFTAGTFLLPLSFLVIQHASRADKTDGLLLSA